MRPHLIAVFALAVCPCAAEASATVYHGAARELRVTPPRVERGPVVDGSLDDPVWAEAAVLESFTHWDPVEGLRDTMRTQCFVLYDDRNLYVGFRCPDDPREIRAPLVTRDLVSEDFVGVDLDTYHDRRRSFIFGCDPNGTQFDGVFQAGMSNPDMTPDYLYTSKGRITPEGYEVEMAIPFSSLRFPPRNSLTFGFVAYRNVARLGVFMFSAPLTRDISSIHAQYGTLEGLAGVRPGRSLQLIPSWTGSRIAEREDGGSFRHEGESRAGLGLKAALTSHVTLDAALTPDFSQVEADAGVVEINRRFEIFYPEKRPFFLEGSEIFASPLDLVYTRRIADPLYGAKLTGKLAGTTLAALHASDRSAGEPIEGIPAALNPYRGGDAIYNLARVKQDVLGGSTLGLLVGNREQAETYNRGLGADGRFTFAEKYDLAFQHARSWSRDRDLRAAIAALDSVARADLDDDVLEREGAIRRGYATRVELARGSQGLDAGAFLTDISPHFAADMGFVPRTDQIQFGASLEPHYFPRNRPWLTEVTPALSYDRTFEHGDGRWAGRLTDENLNLRLELDLPRNTWAEAWVGRISTWHEGRAFPDQRRLGFEAGSRRSRAVRAGVSGWLGESVVFDETVPGRERNLSAWLDLRFGRGLDAGLSFEGSTVERRETGARFADDAVSRLRTTWLLNPALSFRWIAEYRSTRSYDQAGVSEEHERALSLDLLGSYFVRPGTVFYAGYGTRLEGARARGMTTSLGSAFVKLSVLWQG